MQVGFASSQQCLQKMLEFKENNSKLDLSPAKSAEINETILISDLYGFLQDTQADNTNTK